MPDIYRASDVLGLQEIIEEDYPVRNEQPVKRVSEKLKGKPISL